MHRIAAVAAAAALTLTVAGTAFADGTVDWTGQGIKNDKVTEQCDADNPPGSMLWIFTLGGADEQVTDATLTVNGDVYTNGDHKGHIIKFATDWYDPEGSITASVSYVGTLGKGDVNLTISHGCPPATTTTTESETTETTPTTTTTTTTTKTTTTTTSSTDTETTGTETTSTTTTKVTSSGTEEEITPPRTDTLLGAGSGTVSTGVLLLLAGILATALVVIPAAARRR